MSQPLRPLIGLFVPRKGILHLAKVLLIRGRGVLPALLRHGIPISGAGKGRQGFSRCALPAPLGRLRSVPPHGGSDDDGRIGLNHLFEQGQVFNVVSRFVNGPGLHAHLDGGGAAQLFIESHEMVKQGGVVLAEVDFLLPARPGLGGKVGRSEDKTRPARIRPKEVHLGVNLLIGHVHPEGTVLHAGLEVGAAAHGGEGKFLLRQKLCQVLFDGAGAADDHIAPPDQLHGLLHLGNAHGEGDHMELVKAREQGLPLHILHTGELHLVYRNGVYRRHSGLGLYLPVIAK